MLTAQWVLSKAMNYAFLRGYTFRIKGWGQQ